MLKWNTNSQLEDFAIPISTEMNFEYLVNQDSLNIILKFMDHDYYH